MGVARRFRMHESLQSHCMKLCLRTRAARSVICGFASLCCNLSYERCCTKVVQRKSSHCSSPQLNFHAWSLKVQLLRQVVEFGERELIVTANDLAAGSCVQGLIIVEIDCLNCKSYLETRRSAGNWEVAETGETSTADLRKKRVDSEPSL
jgi:hypothetical protein